MLTLKVITTDIEGQNETHLFYGERIQHKETESKDHMMKFVMTQNEMVISSSALSETPSSGQAYQMSRVFIYGDGDTPKQLLWILPCADCFVMYNGKTIDTFSARFK
jgi:hypothetical protein